MQKRSPFENIKKQDGIPRINPLTLIHYKLGRPLTAEQKRDLARYSTEMAIKKYIEQSGDLDD